jgi:hypothetical protein
MEDSIPVPETALLDPVADHKHPVAWTPDPMTRIG